MKAIYHLREKGIVRGVDIAREFKVSKPTVSVALRKMEDAGLIIVRQSRSVELTEKGEQIAREVIERYETLYGFLTGLGIDQNTAHYDACKMEHEISKTTLEAFRELRQYLHEAAYVPRHPVKTTETGALCP